MQTTRKRSPSAAGVSSAAQSRAASAPVFGPAGACDTHVHVFGPQHRFPYVADRRYTPPDALLSDYQAVMVALGLDRAVLTAPSVHGMDNSALLDAMRNGGPGFRGVVMTTPDVEDATLREWHAAGVRAVRTQLKRGGGKPVTIKELRAIAERIAPLGWHVEIHVDVHEVPNIDECCADFPVPVVIEHMGHMSTRYGLNDPGFRALLRLLHAGAWIKLSGPYIVSAKAAPYDDLRPFIDALADTAPGRTLWGSNWPHPHQDAPPDDRLLAELIACWLDEGVLREVMIDNPAELYGF